MKDILKKCSDGALLLLLVLAAFALGYTAYLFRPLLEKTFYEPVTLYSMGDGLAVFLNAAFWLILLAALLQLLLKSERFEEYRISGSDNLPLTRVALLSLLTIIPIAFISWKTNWQVKVFYDFGSRMQGFEMMKQIAVTVCEPVKAAYIALVIYISQKMFEKAFPKKKNFIYGGVTAMLTIGLAEFILKTHYLPYTYLMMMPYFGLLHLLTDRNFVKTYFLIVFIYMF